jgi:DNA-binding NtrC family response regulator
MATILIADDEKNLRGSVERLLHLEGHRALQAADGEAALGLLGRDEIDLLILDLEMPRRDGMAVLEAMRAAGIDTPVIVLTGHGSIDRAVQAVRRGALDFLEKPPDPERLLLAVRNALRLGRLDREVRDLRGALRERHALVGEGPAMAALRRDIGRAASTDSPVLVTGENGTGKELVARAVHDASARRDGPFVAVNCAALPADLFESEIFGHERGAFTGAVRRQAGRFERAAGGTLFLDEIGEIPPALQAKLLRALDTMTVERLGGDGPIRVDARVIAATNRDLAAAMVAGTFRQDLYYRLAVLPIAVPPLRARREEIAPLARHFLAELRRERGTGPRRLSDGAAAALVAHDYPGNVRELRNLVERLSLLAAGEEIGDAEARAVLSAAPAAPGQAPASPVAPEAPAQAPSPPIAPASPEPPVPAGAGGTEAGTLKDALRAAERRLILAALERNRWQMARTARQLGLERSHLYRKLKSFGIRPPD